MNFEGLHISNIYCIGRNYAQHAKELGNAVPVEPLVFLKPTGSLLREGKPFVLPTFSQRIDHEVEVVGRVNRDLNGFSHFCVGLDLTARDLQDEAKKKGQPWTLAKGFKDSAILGPWIDSKTFGAPVNQGFSLKVNGDLRQTGNLSNMIFNFTFLLEYLKSRFTLLEGDILFSGTPEGVGPLVAGDKLEIELDGLSNSRRVIQVQK